MTVRKLAIARDRTTQAHPVGVLSCCKLFCVCDIVGGEARASMETSEVAWFVQSALPDDLSLARVLPYQLARMFVHASDPALPADFD